MYWSCVLHGLVMRQTCVGHVSNMCRSCFRQVLIKCQSRLGHFVTCIGHVSDKVWTCFKHVQVMFQTSADQVPVTAGTLCDMYWSCFRQSSDMVQTWSGRVSNTLWPRFTHLGHVPTRVWLHTPSESAASARMHLRSAQTRPQHACGLQSIWPACFAGIWDYLRH